MFGQVLTIFSLLVHCLLLSNASETKDSISSIFESLGYSPGCVASALTTCELSGRPCPAASVTDSLSELKEILQSIKVDKNRPKNCEEVLLQGDTASGVRTVYPYEDSRIGKPVVVYCDQTTDGGGWTVFQNRDSLPLRENFFRPWAAYVLGFGNVSGEFWLGLDNIQALVSSSLAEMRVDLEDYEGEKRWARYGTFYIGDASSKYAISVEDYTGDAGNGFGQGRHNGHKFSTYDQDNDGGDSNCARVYKGGWWYDNCHISNLNGFQYVGKHETYADGINWHPFHEYHYSLKKASMKVRPLFREGKQIRP